MQVPQNMSGAEKFNLFRKQFRFLSFENYQARIDHSGLHVEYQFNLDEKYIFKPGFTIPGKRFLQHFPTPLDLQHPLIANLIIHIGLIELISYWKTACPKIIIIKPIHLSPDQIEWWKQIYFQGLGEFFYTNQIQTNQADFVTIESTGTRYEPQTFETDETIIVPIGGGKDSVVTLELLKKENTVRPFILNPRGATLDCAAKAGFGRENILEINRRLDPQLLELNTLGYLNGHTPFSALLAFYSLLIARVSGHKHIALSNESSANEPTVAGTDVNHQYSKSFGFEKSFRQYVTRNISDSYNYFSFLRPLNELQIASLFARQVKYYPVFKSCNAGSKTDSWCGNCPKCLFAFTILSPFIPMLELEHIFGSNLFGKPEMLGYLKELTGIDAVKPFECVGTIDEVNAALHRALQLNHHQKLPLLLDYYSNTSLYSEKNIVHFTTLMSELNPDHFLLPDFIKLIEAALA